MGWRRKRTEHRRENPERVFLRTLNSRRLTLVAATPELVRADLEGGEALAERLDAEVAENWPPDLYDRGPMEFALRQLADPAEQGWSFWYLVDDTPARRAVVGICGFKGRPDASGSVEIGYSILPQYRNQGFASEAVERLVGWAFSHQSVLQVSAETLPHLEQSIRVMKKNGFAYSGQGSERGVIRYAVARPDRR